MIYRNKHRSGNLGNLMFGFVQAADAIVRILSLGFLSTRFPVEYARREAMRAYIAAVKKTSKRQKT